MRERTTQELSSVLSLTVGAFYFSQKNTDEQNTQRATETLSQPISQNLTANVSCSSTPNTHHPSPNKANHQHLTPITQHPTRLIINTQYSTPNTQQG
ncbi:hypothetical protein [Prevotella sp. C561]|uniref:hypothetical protein n=1 Tax=Prevotella sp. C561 TaxID=563031 RepID=UPI0012FB81AB|nr:hypothetical protein [Prevotella sp. C561]